MSHVFILDVRRSFCFSALENNQCSIANGLNITKSTCCCSMAAGWGDPCELCPEKRTSEFEYYCPNGVGLERNKTGNQSKIPWWWSLSKVKGLFRTSYFQSLPTTGVCWTFVEFF